MSDEVSDDLPVMEDEDLFYAIDNFERLQELLSERSLKPPDRDAPVSLLNSAAARGSRKILELLLDQGGQEFIDAPSCGMLAWTPLISAANQNNLPNVRLLLERGANPNFIDDSVGSDSALHIAVNLGSLELVKILLQYNADPLQAGFMHLTPLDRANERAKKLHDDVVSHSILHALKKAAEIF